MTDEVMFEIREMTGQVYKNVYAGKSTDGAAQVATIGADPVASEQSSSVDELRNGPVSSGR